MGVPYVSSDSLWIGFDNVESVTLKVLKALSSIEYPSIPFFQ